MRGRRRHKIQCQLRQSLVAGLAIQAELYGTLCLKWCSVLELCRVTWNSNSLACKYGRRHYLCRHVYGVKLILDIMTNPSILRVIKSSITYIFFTADEFVLSINSCLNTAAKAYSCVALAFNRQCRKGTQLVRKWQCQKHRTNDAVTGESAVL